MIKEVNGSSVTIDFNHPLAGQSVTFVIDLVEIL
jgi:FKBP-type peptidyl-prolyl cis-trans isomerase SlpA